LRLEVSGDGRLGRVRGGGQVQLHQCVDGLVRRVDDVHQARVRANLDVFSTRRS
jgi:hypothetical protein